MANPCLSAPQPVCTPAGDVGCLDPSRATYTPKSWLRGPVVTVRSGHNATVTFTAPLSRDLGISRYRYVAVLHDPTAKDVHFVFTNDETAHGGAFTLGFNGGASRKKGSPSRCFQAPAHRLPFLRRGAYRAKASGGDHNLVVTIDLDDPV
ncbi:MAG: hypothetical protein KJ015_09790 [Myxococcales bacterium]|nr:hypothetical protein [Myxococcales bacterium]